MFYFFSKNSLPSAPWPALGKVWFFLKKKFFVECPLAGTRQSLNFFKKKFFAEYHGHGTRQSWKNDFSSAHFSSFAECCDYGTRQRCPLLSATLGRVTQNSIFYFFYIPSWQINPYKHISHIYLIHHIYISSIHTSICTYHIHHNIYHIYNNKCSSPSK